MRGIEAITLYANNLATDESVVTSLVHVGRQPALRVENFYIIVCAARIQYPESHIQRRARLKRPQAPDGGQAC